MYLQKKSKSRLEIELDNFLVLATLNFANCLKEFPAALIISISLKVTLFQGKKIY